MVLRGKNPLGEWSLGEKSLLGFRGNVIRGNVVRGIDVEPKSLLYKSEMKYKN
jgi:hypothetical protein